MTEIEKWRGVVLAAAILASAAALARMPVPLLDNDAVVDPARWKAAAPVLQAALECRRIIDPADPALRPLLPKNEASQWKLIPPQGFAVLGLPVQSITLYIDPDGKLRASYTASVAAPYAMAAPAVQSYNRRQGAIGTVRVEPGDRLSISNIICTVGGTREHE